MRPGQVGILGALPVVLTARALPLHAQTPGPPVDPVEVLVSRLSLDGCKATSRGLTQCGDRRQGTDRNRAAIDWIEVQLASCGCAPERCDYADQPPPPAAPAAVGNHVTNTDSAPFMNFTAAISLWENGRGMHIGPGWNPHWHQPTDRFAAYSDQDFRLGLNAARTTLAAVAQLVSARLGP